jgi:glycosyltransferase involved in cell wall biosynthesis
MITKMIKVCHMTSVHKNDDIRIYHKECVSLSKAGYEVYLVAQGGSFDICGVHVIGIGILPNSRIQRMMASSKAIYKEAIKIDADIYHIHDPELLPYALKLKKKGKKVVFDSHEDVPEQIKEKIWIPYIIRLSLSAIYKLYQKYICRRIDAIISVTPHICEKFKNLNQNVYLITNYPLIKLPLNQHNEFGTRNICFPGSIAPEWCHEKIIEALSFCGNTKYVLCGNAIESYLKKLKGLSNWDRVDYKGKITRKEVTQLLSESDIGIALADYSGNVGDKMGTLGNTKLFEYMLAGIPVICTDFILWKEIIKNNECGICVSPKNIREISDAINYLFDNPKIAQKMGENGRKAVLEKYNWNFEEIELLKLYSKLGIIIKEI